MPDQFKKAVSAAYIHIPFCVRKCTYCDFCSYPGQTAATIDIYSKALANEIIAAAHWAESTNGPGCRPLDSVFVGGGTPTLMSGQQLSGILHALAQNFGLSDSCEITLEANPGTVTADSLSQCRAAGFNRISLGLQAVQPRLLNLLGRIHSCEDFDRSVRLATDAGFQSINADIMVGLPGQTLADIDETVDFLLRQPVDHVSFYSLILEDGTPLKARCELEPGLLPDEEAERAQYHRVRQRLIHAGFNHYEISNAARRGHECRHNLVYWHALGYYGFGTAAHSCLQGIRRGNAESLESYLSTWRSVQADPFAAATILEELDTLAEMKEVMMLGLRLISGVRDADFYSRFGQHFFDVFPDEINRLTARGLLTSDSEHIRLSELGLDLANQVFMEFV
ncbi:MAG TPA: coproporphyrinogen III oxidase [Clostridiales bacterium]|nr:coproporphyrinogen III oxidase [Clostridiales bacterium]